MVIDSSAALAVLLEEPEAEELIAAIEGDPARLMSAVSVAEAGIVLEQRLGFEAGRDLDDFIREAAIQIVPADEEQSRIARRAYRLYGRGNHPAKLNFGDCFAYALAKARNQSLLFKGDDFSKTDIVQAVPT